MKILEISPTTAVVTVIHGMSEHELFRETAVRLSKKWCLNISLTSPLSGRKVLTRDGIHMEQSATVCLVHRLGYTPLDRDRLFILKSAPLDHLSRNQCFVSKAASLSFSTSSLLESRRCTPVASCSRSHSSNLSFGTLTSS